MTDLVAVELTQLESEVLRQGLLQWLGPARMTEPVARALWFESRDDFESNLDRLRDAVGGGEPLSALDWHSVLAATELVFVSWALGAGGDWVIVTGIDDDATLRELRSIQRKLARVHPWPEPDARPSHTA